MREEANVYEGHLPSVAPINTAGLRELRPGKRTDGHDYHDLLGFLAVTPLTDLNVLSASGE